MSFVRLGADGVHGVDGYVEQPTVAGSTHAEADFWRMRTGAAILEDFGRNGRMDTKARCSAAVTFNVSTRFVYFDGNNAHEVTPCKGDTRKEEMGCTEEFLACLGICIKFRSAWP